MSSRSSPQVTSLSPRDIVDFAVRAGVAAKIEGIDKTQVAKLLEVLWNSPEDRAIDIVILHIIRQVGRDRIRINTARYLVRGLVKIKNSYESPKEAKSIAAEFLGLFKWVYEGIQRIRVNIRWNELNSINLEELLRRINYIR